MARARFYKKETYLKGTLYADVIVACNFCTYFDFSAEKGQYHPLEGFPACVSITNLCIFVTANSFSLQLGVQAQRN